MCISLVEKLGNVPNRTFANLNSFEKPGNVPSFPSLPQFGQFPENGESTCGLMPPHAFVVCQWYIWGSGVVRVEG